MSSNPVLVEAHRGGIVESFHRGAFAVLDADGGVLHARGDIERPVFPRSAVKLLQALPVVAGGAAEALQLSDAELALTCASHSGEEVHVQAAASMLAKAGVGDDVLECGSHWPYDEAAARALARAGATPGPLHNNCSGKHAGFVCVGCLLAGRRDVAAFLRGYVAPEHPVMREATASLQATTGFDLANTARGIDGCSIPTFAIPLRHLARAFARAGTGVGLDADRARAARRLREAIAAAPWMVGGSDRFDSVMMARLGARVCCKVGAEGVHCAALPELGLGIAVKMDDGNNARAVEVVMAALICALLPLTEADAAFVGRFSDAPLTNRKGTVVGRLRASFALV